MSRSDNELPTKMASLDIIDMSAIGNDEHKPPESSPSRRTLRKRAPSPKKAATSNRRVKMKPKKLASAINEDEIRKIYNDTKVSPASQSLETIYEEPKTFNDTLLLIGGRKIKRSLKFPETSVHTKEKIKKRRSKIKRFLGNKNFGNRKKMSMQAFLETLQNIEADDDNDEPKNGS